MSQKKTERETRLAEQLRANLKRRKVQARTRIDKSAQTEENGCHTGSPVINPETWAGSKDIERG